MKPFRMELDECRPRSHLFRNRWVVVSTLTLLNVSNQWSRYILSYLAAVPVLECTELCDDVSFVPVCVACGSEACETCSACRFEHKATFYNVVDGCCVSESGYGILAGLGFGLPFCVAGMFAGLLVDRYRQHIVGILATVGLGWSLAVGAQSFCRSYAPLLGLRVVQGVMQAFAAPCSYALLAGHFSGAKRAAANGVYSFGTYLGYGVASLSILMSLSVGWRASLGIAASAGAACALAVLLFVKRPAVVVAVATMDKYGDGSGGGVLALLTSRVFLTLLAAASVRYLGGVVISSFVAIFYSRAFPDDMGSFAALNALAISIGGSLSSYAGGVLGSTWASRRPDALGIIPAAGCGLALLPLAVVLYARSFMASICGLFAAMLLGECWLGPAAAVLQDAVSARHTGVAVSAYMFSITVVGSFASSAVGAADPGTASLRHVLAAALLLTYGGSSILFARMAFLLRRGGSSEGSLSKGESQRLLDDT